MSGFGMNLSHVPHIRSYLEANSYWERSEYFKDSHYKDLGHRRKQHVCMWKDNDKIHFRLYHTDVVTYFPDGSIRIKPHSSSATNQFAYRLLPSGINPYFTGRVMTLQIGDRVYALNRGGALLRQVNGEWTFDETTPPDQFEKQMVDKAQAKAALAETNYADFRAVLPVMRSMLGATYEKPRWRMRDSQYVGQNHPTVVKMLSDRAQWAGLAKAKCSDGFLLSYIREAVYRQERDRCRLTVTEPWLKYGEHWSWVRYG